MRAQFRDILLDEISLEGLDGITLEALWTRLSERLDIPKPFSVEIKSTFWTIVDTFDCVDIYELPEPRPELVLYNRYNNIDPDLGVILEPENPPQDVYPYHPVDDVNKGIRGSCQHYYTRKNITTDVKNTDLKDVENKWGSKIVLVASQRERYNSLIGGCHLPCTNIPIIQYCLLERIGRSRYHGEITQGKVSLQVIDKDPKSLSYHCKKLFNIKLTTKQLCYQKTNTCNNSGRLIHLPRFYVEKKPKSFVLAEKIIEFIRVKKNCCATYEDLKKHLGPKKKGLKKLLKTAEMQRILKTDLRIFYREIFPNASVSEWKRKGCDKERTIQCVQLLDPEININNIWDSDETFDDDNENIHLSTKNQLLDKSIMSEAYNFIEQSKNEGLSQQEIGLKLGRNKLQARSVCRKLARNGQMTSYMANSGRQRVTRYVAVQHYDKISELHTELNKIIKENETAAQSSGCRESDRSKRKLDRDEDDDEPNSKKIRVDEVSKPDESSDQKRNDTVSFSEADLNQITTKISLIKSDHGFSKNVKVSLSLDEMKSHGVTYRLGKRANFIIKSVKSLKVIQDVVRILKMIITEERKERHPSQICKKSLTRLLMKLSYHGFLKLYKAEVASPTQNITLTFVCDRGVEEDHQIIKSAIEQVKLKLCSLIMPSDVKHPKAPAFPTFEVKKIPKSLMDYDVSAGRKYGLAPKFMRMRLLHQFLYYLVYERDRIIKVELEDVLEKFENRDFEIDDEIRALLSSVHNANELDKMFVPPLPLHKDYPKGWFLVCDVLLRMPLSLFVQLVNVTYRVPGIEKYLEHPIKKHFLIKQLPTKIRSVLLYKRKYIFKVHEVMQNLCFVGLVQFGAQRFKDKEQVFVYLNRRTTLVDTTSSEMGYHHVSDKQYPSKSYEFCSQRDVDLYWYELMDVCTNTGLGTRKAVMGKQIELESAYAKPALMAALKSKKGDEAVEQDDGSVPGDHKGAAGFDSALFAHLLRNWQYVLTNKQAVEPATSSTKTVSAKAKRAVSKIKNVPVTKNPFVHKRIVEKKKAKQEEFKLLKSQKTPGVGKKILRRVPNAKKEIRRPYYDESDMNALKQMSKLRVDWSATEDHVLLLCKVALLTVYDDMRAPDKKCVFIRDTIRRTIHSHNKTSRACQRRINYMMKNPSTENSVMLCYEETKRIPEVQNLMRLKSRTNQPIVFIELFRILYKKFRDINISDQFTESNLSDSMEKFFGSYNIHLLSDFNKDTIFDEPSDEIGIQQTVITSVIHSSMCSAKDKINWSYHMLYIYQKYPDYLLKNALTRVRRMQMIAVKKRFSKKKLNNVNNTWPLGTNAFYLSCYYSNKFLTKYPYSVYQECFRNMSCFTEKIYNGDAVKDQGVKVVPSTGGVAAAIIEMYLNFDMDFNIEIPEQVIILDPNCSVEDAAFKRIKKHFQDIFESVQNNMAISTVSLSDDDEDDKLDDDNLASLDVKELTSSQQKTIANTNEDKITRSTRLALYMMREEQTTAVSENANTQHMHDFFLVNSSKVYIDIPDAKEKLSLPLISADKKELLEQIVRDSQIPPKAFTDKEVEDRVSATWSLEAEVKLASRVIEFVKNKGSLGVTMNELKEHYNQTACETLFVVLCKLVEMKILIKCGVNRVTYVHQSKAKCWYVESFRLKRLDREKIDSSTKAVVIENIAEEREKAVASTSGVLEDNEGRSETVRAEKVTEIISEQTTAEKDVSEPMEVCQEISYESAIGTNAVTETATEPMEIDSNFSSEKLESVEDSTAEDLNVRNENDNSEAMVIDQDAEETANQNREVSEPSGDEVTSTDQTNKTDTKAENVLLGNRSSVKFIPAPWFRVDGTLNRKVLDRYLGTLLNHCMCQPGISVEKLCKYFMYLKHVEVFALVQYLVKLGCVELVKLKKAKVTLFSKPTEIETVPSVGFEDFNEILLEPIHNCLSKLSAFIGVPEYTVEFP